MELPARQVHEVDQDNLEQLVDLEHLGIKDNVEHL